MGFGAIIALLVGAPGPTLYVESGRLGERLESRLRDELPPEAFVGRDAARLIVQIGSSTTSIELLITDSDGAVLAERNLGAPGNDVGPAIRVALLLVQQTAESVLTPPPPEPEPPRLFAHVGGAFSWWSQPGTARIGVALEVAWRFDVLALTLGAEVLGLGCCRLAAPDTRDPTIEGTARSGSAWFGAVIQLFQVDPVSFAFLVNAGIDGTSVEVVPSAFAGSPAVETILVWSPAATAAAEASFAVGRFRIRLQAGVRVFSRTLAAGLPDPEYGSEQLNRGFVAPWGALSVGWGIL